MSIKTEQQWVEAGDLCLIREITMEIHNNGEKAGSVSCTPRDLEELATGWLLTDGGISRVAQINSINICLEQNRIEVETEPGAPAKPDSSPAKKGIWGAEDMKAVHALFAVDPPLFRVTQAAHSCMILRKREVPGETGERLAEADPEANPDPNPEQPAPEVLWRSEDAGRHSALDKAIGWAAIHGVDLGECLLMTSGRISTRMAAKAGIAGAAALAGRGTVTAEALELAKKYDMTLMGYVSAEGAVVFNPVSPANDEKDHDEGKER